MEHQGLMKVIFVTNIMRLALINANILNQNERTLAKRAWTL